MEEMNKLLAAMFAALLMAGCGEEAQRVSVQAEASPESNQSFAETPSVKSPVVPKIDLDDNETLDKILAEALDLGKLQRRVKEGEVIWYYEQTRYTGSAKYMHDNGQIAGLFQLKDGKKNGLVTAWYSNGQKVSPFGSYFTLLAASSAVEQFKRIDGGQMRLNPDDWTFSLSE
jgi:hypothetical protein